MTDQEYEEKYNSKTTKQLCSQWRRIQTKKFKKWKMDEIVENIKKITDEDILKYAMSKLLEELNNGND